MARLCVPGNLMLLLLLLLVLLVMLMLLLRLFRLGYSDEAATRCRWMHKIPIQRWKKNLRTDVLRTAVSLSLPLPLCFSFFFFG